MYKYLFVILLILGCGEVGLQKVDKWQPQNLTDAKVLAEALKNTDESDIKNIYKEYSGIAECLKNCDDCFSDTIELQEVFKKYKEKYDFDGAGPDFETALGKYLSVRGVVDEEDSRSIVDKVDDEKTQIARSELIETIQTVADAARLSLEEK